MVPRLLTPSVRNGQGAFLLSGDSCMADKQKGTLCVFLAALCYSIGGLCIKVIPWNGISINGARTAIALVVIGIYLWIVKHPLRLNRWILFGGISVFATNLLYSVANKLTTAANAIVLQFTATIFVVLFSMLFFHRKPGKIDVVACVIVFGGVVFFFADSLSMGGWLGNLFALLSGITYAVVFMLNDLPDGDPISSVFWGDVISALVGLPFLVRETDFSFVPIFSVLVLGTVQVAFAYIFLTIGLRTTPAITASLVSGIEPVLNPLLVAVFYGEKMGRFAFIGAVIVIGGVLTYNVLKIRMESNDLKIEVNNTDKGETQ